MKLNRSLLVIDDDADVGEFISTAGIALGYECVATTDPTCFIQALVENPDLIFLDLVMPEMDGIELLRILGHRHCTSGIVLISGVGKRVMETAEHLAHALELTIFGHLQKPFRLADLEDLLRRYAQPEPALAAVKKSLPHIEASELRDAIQNDQLVLHYQPQIEIATGHVCGVEALVRWQHPTRGLIAPDDFIPQAEFLNLIDQLGWTVSERALTEIGQLCKLGLGCPLLSINVSVYSLRDLKFPDIFAAMLSRHGIAPNRVILEITESGLIKELSNTLDVLTRLRMKQIQLSIDDFGTGYSMMQQLRHVPATEVKIDKAFVQNMLASDSDRILVQKTIEIGRELGMKVVAEGVETIEQLEILRASRCDVAQGYLFSRPLPLEDLILWLQRSPFSMPAMETHA